MRIVLKIGIWTLTGIIALCIVAVSLLYAPPVQDWLRRQLVETAMRQTGLKVKIDGIGLRFPLKLRIRGVWVADTTCTAVAQDTLLYVRGLDVGVQAAPLLHGKMEVDGITLEGVRVNSADLLPGLQVAGDLERFFVAAHGIDLKNENARLDRVELDGVRVKVAMSDTTLGTPPDTTQNTMNWRVALGTLKLRNIEVNLQLPEEQTALQGRVENLQANEGEVDLRTGRYSLETFRLEGTSVNYNSALDNQRLDIRDIHARLDSLFWQGQIWRAYLTELGLDGPKGLEITKLSGNLQADTNHLRIGNLRLRTPYSEIGLQAGISTSLLANPSQGQVDIRLDGRIGRQDLLLLASDLPEAFRRDCPPHPLRIALQADGNLATLRLQRVEVCLPGAFELKGNGEGTDLIDNTNREACIDLQMQTGRLEFLKSLIGEGLNQTFAIPDSMCLKARFGLQGSGLTARLKWEESTGRLNADMQYNLMTEVYRATLKTDSLQLHHFLPTDSLYDLTLHTDIRGRGTDFTSPHTYMGAQLKLNTLRYGAWDLTDIGLTVHAGDSIGLSLSAGDLNLRFHARGTVDKLMRRTERLTVLLKRQLEEQVLDHAALRRTLPEAEIQIRAGMKNPLSDWLRQKHIRFERFRFGFGLSTEKGINGRTDLRGLHVDSLQLDTLFLVVQQDTSRIRLQGGVVNEPDNPQFVFRTTLTGEVRNEDAELILDYTDEQGETGILLGMNARPLTKGDGRWGDGLLLRLVPQQPVIAYRRFDFADNANWIYLHRDGHVYAGVDMRSEDGIGLNLMSEPKDTVSLQNIRLALTSFRLSELSRVMPYLPRLTGLLSVEGHCIQTRETLQVSGQANVKELTYEGRKVGDVGVEAAWLPREEGKHYLGAALKLDGQEVADVKGMLDADTENETPVDLLATLKYLPLAVADAFIPDDMAKLAGKANGTFHMTGTQDAPRISGDLTLDSASVYVGMLGARYYLDNRPIQIVDGTLTLDAFAIYTNGANPFTIDGSVKLDTPQGPMADLRLQANNYTLLDARRTRESLVYGKVVADLDAAVKGPVDALAVRGSMHLLGTTDLTYVLTDSPLTVDDRLSGLVTFVSFADTTGTERNHTTAPPPGGMDLLMTVRIDDAVRLRADLSPDRSKYIELEGGGDLSLRYTPQGDMSLTGRYTLSDGVLKYSLPVIPLKEFHISRGSYVDWSGDVINPTLELTATEQMRASVAEGDDGQTRMVDFEVSVGIKGRLSSPELGFDINAPHDATVQNELLAMGPDERGKQAIAMLATGIYLNSGIKGGGIDMGAALNSVLQSQINSLAGQIKGASISVGVEDHTSTETGAGQTDYSFRYAQRFFGDRVQIVIGGKVSTGAGATNSVESFIDNISLEYRLDASGTRYIRAFYNKNYESVLDGEITETGVGLVLRRKVDRLSELFIFRKKKEDE